MQQSRGGRPRARHPAAVLLVAAYAIGAAVVAAAGAPGGVSRWLALHLLLLGAASTAVLVWSRHFARGLLHPARDRARAADACLGLLTAGAVLVLAGVAAARPLLTEAGAGCVVATAGWHAGGLAGMARERLSAARLRDVVWFYVGSALALAVGGSLGAVLAVGGVRGSRAAARVEAAHVHANLLGWVGLAVVGTLFVLWPTILRTRMDADADRLARPALGCCLAGLALAVASLLAGSRVGAAVGVAGYAVGVGLSLVPFVRTARRRPPRTLAAWSLAAATGWLLAGLGVDLAGLAGAAASPAPDLDALVPLWALGMAGQALVGALSFLVPTNLGGGPAGNRRMTGVLETGWIPRLVVTNAGVLLACVPSTAATNECGWVLAGAGLGSFLPLLAAGLLARRRLPA